LCVALGFLGFHFRNIDWRGKHSNLLRNAEKLFKPPPFEEGVPQG
jgi:hypothetical protein